jgi:hypothetical protein
VILTRYAAVGLRLFGSINKLTSFGGVAVNVQLGRLRN